MIHYRCPPPCGWVTEVELNKGYVCKGCNEYGVVTEVRGIQFKVPISEIKLHKVGCDCENCNSCRKEK